MVLIRKVTQSILLYPKIVCTSRTKTYLVHEIGDVVDAVDDEGLTVGVGREGTCGNQIREGVAERVDEPADGHDAADGLEGLKLFVKK